MNPVTSCDHRGIVAWFRPVIQSFPNHTRDACHELLIEFKALLQWLPKSWETDREKMIKIMDELAPIAKEKGIYVITGFWNNGKGIYWAIGRQGPLEWKWDRHTPWLGSSSLNTPISQQNSFTPQYQLLTCAYGSSCPGLASVGGGQERGC
jgi:hypothetical protein